MKCKNCGKDFVEKYSKWASGIFCSRSCTAKYNGNHLIFSTKTVKCINCGKEIEAHSQSSNKLCKCDKCKKYKSFINKNGKKTVKSKCNICGEWNCFRKDICKLHQLFPALIKYFGLDETKLGTIKIYEEFDRIKNMLIEDYYDKELSTVEMAKKYKHNNNRNFNKILNSLKIKRRNLSEAVSLAIKNNNFQLPHNTKYKSGYHTTWNNKHVFYRSSYELDFAKELDEKKIDYEMEKLRILYWDSQLLHQRTAIPDFYLPETNEIIEIKSTWTYDEQNMKDKIKAYKEHGYKVKLILEHKEVKIYTNLV